MAGTFGLKKQNYRNSLRAGWPLISALRHTSIQAGTTVGDLHDAAPEIDDVDLTIVSLAKR